MNKQYLILILSILILSSSSLIASGLPSKLELIGDVSIRRANKVDFVRVVDNFIDCSNGLILKASPSFKHKLASNTKVLIGSHTITMFPGALLKIGKSGIIPMLGRFDIRNTNENTPSILFTTTKFSCEFCHGKIIIEMCPNGDSHIACPKQVKAWIKEKNRKINVLEAGTEMFFPAFGLSKSQSIISARWSQSPAGYANIDVTAAKSPEYMNASKTKALEQTSNDIEMLASDTIIDKKLASETQTYNPIASDTTINELKINEEQLNN